jgi:hypothetical protein
MILHENDHFESLDTRGIFLLSISVFPWRCGPTRAMDSTFLRFLDHSQWRTTVGKTPLDEWSALRTDLEPTTHDIHKRQTSMLPEVFEPSIPAEQRQQTHALDRAATPTGSCFLIGRHTFQTLACAPEITKFSWFFSVSQGRYRNYLTFSQHRLYPPTFQNIMLLTDPSLVHILTVSLNKPVTIKNTDDHEIHFSTTQVMNEDFISSKVDQ